MIFRQDLERMLWNYQEEHQHALARLQHWEGVLHALTDNEAEQEKIQEAMQKIQHWRDTVLMASACEQTVTYQIRHIDLEEVDLNIVNPLKSIPVEVES